MTAMEMRRSMMSYLDLLDFFWGYALEMTTYILNLVLSKSVPSTHIKLCIGHKPSLNHVQIWDSLVHVLKEKSDKPESRIEVCLFLGYPRGIKGGLFYSPRNQKVIVSTNARFVEEDYMMNHKPRSRVVIEELRKDISTNASSILTVQEDTLQVDKISFPSRSGRIVGY